MRLYGLSVLLLEGFTLLCMGLLGLKVKKAGVQECLHGVRLCVSGLRGSSKVLMFLVLITLWVSSSRM